jgi:hypothetical protein
LDFLSKKNISNSFFLNEIISYFANLVFHIKFASALLDAPHCQSIGYIIIKNVTMGGNPTKGYFRTPHRNIRNQKCYVNKRSDLFFQDQPFKAYKPDLESTQNII